ncbi:MAG: ribosome biogenesis GTP-binding protein YihA/YsxC [Nitrospira sp.]|nr:ribosome biogenesis GTP-binding protein YihA/YsxC [Nitrospira sp.]
MKIKSATFVMSNTDYKKCPQVDIPEYAFIGRSNVGKSSLINYLTNLKGLARASDKPGKTQVINHFIINEAITPWYLVDLPGYGFASVPKSKREEWDTFLMEYILNRKNLLCLFVLIDSRLEPQYNDMRFMEWLSDHEVPFVMVFTKTDKLSPGQLIKNIDTYNKVMLDTWEKLPKQFLTSSAASKGKKEILHFIEETNKIMDMDY